MVCSPRKRPRIQRSRTVPSHICCLRTILGNYDNEIEDIAIHVIDDIDFVGTVDDIETEYILN